MLRKQIRDIYTPKIIGVPPEMLVSEAIGIMHANKVSCILVFENEALIGILTERIFIFNVVNGDVDFARCRVKNMMRSSVLTVKEDTYIYEAFGLLTSKNLRHMVVVDQQNKAIGVVTYSNMLEHLVYEDFLEVKKVSEIMSRSVCTVSGEDAVHRALVEMVDKSVSCILIVENDHPAGILTERDMARMVTGRIDIFVRKVREEMSSPVITIPKDVVAYDAASVMKREGIHRLVVVSEDDRVVGIITQSDIVRGLEGKYIQILKETISEKEAVIEETMRDLYNKTIYLDNILRSCIDMGVVASDMNLRIAYFNPAAEDILGYCAGDVIGRSLNEIHLKENIDSSLFDWVMETVRKTGQHAFMFERVKDDRKRYIQGNVFGVWDKNQDLIGYVFMVSDITERKINEEVIRYMAYYDILTGLPNRAMFYERLAHDLTHAKRNRTKLALMIIDIDRFKEINDSRGHHAGDILLKTMGSRLKGALRGDDTVARIGGDEFVVILPQINGVDDAVLVAEKITQEAERPFDIEGWECRAGVSIGISIYPLHGEDSEILIKLADQAMYTAKDKGRVNCSSNACLHPL
ncbi:MAG: diguanylate cyclase [Deltaproteobacteria bacterium]|nr:diguanylate cyclase [Deltaproteobacteria bacterium]